MDSKEQQGLLVSFTAFDARTPALDVIRDVARQTERERETLSISLADRLESRAL